jgi:hypothetical protein
MTQGKGRNLTDFQWVNVHYTRFEEDLGIWGFECRKCGLRLESDTPLVDLWPRA